MKGEVTPGTPASIKIEPVAGSTKPTMNVDFAGPLCALDGEFPVKGNFTVSSELGDEQAEHGLSVTSSELKSASDTDTLTGAAAFKLASGDTGASIKGVELKA